MNIENMTNLIRAAELRGLTPTVRVRQKNAADILQGAGCGRDGSAGPTVKQAEEAALVASWAKYAPEGDRGYAASQRSALYGNCDPAEYARQANEDTLVRNLLRNA
jgi:4-hydroxy-2-oxoheptanedioate aldolase